LPLTEQQIRADQLYTNEICCDEPKLRTQSSKNLRKTGKKYPDFVKLALIEPSVVKNPSKYGKILSTGFFRT
jgi:hypothetical protein